MPAHVFLDSIELQVETLAQSPTTTADPCYPLPYLESTGNSAVMEFQAVVLQNDYLEVVILPDLGGRIFSAKDRVSGTDLFARRTSLEMKGDGPRGAYSPTGIRFDIGGSPRMNDLGPVEYQVRDAEDGSEDATVILFELGVGRRTSWHAAITLAVDEPLLTISVSTLNRDLNPAVIDVGMSFPAMEAVAAPSGWATLDPSTGGGFSISCQEATMLRAGMSQSGLHLLRRGADAPFGPRQADSFTLQLRPIVGLSTLTEVGDGVALGIDEKIEIATTSNAFRGKVYVQTGDGQTLESPIALQPSEPFVVDKSSFPSGVLALVVRNDDDVNILEWSANVPGRYVPMLDEEQTSAPMLPFVDWADVHEPDLRRLALNLQWRHPSEVQLASFAMEDGRFHDAIDHLESALAYNAEDPLTWWQKALAHRLAGDNDADRPELPNAHFLAPLEPALRAEAFLGMPHTHGKEPNPLIAPMANHPDALLEVASLLLECGLFGEAARWIDECLRHREEPMLRYLLAWRLFVDTRMAAEAAMHVDEVENIPIQAPYPWRRYEIEAVRFLAETCPQSERLRRLSQVIQF